MGTSEANEATDTQTQEAKEMTQETEVRTSPLPWVQYANGPTIYARNHSYVAVVQSAFSKDDAALIVESVNGYADLQWRVRDLIQAISSGFDDIPTVDGACDWADVANLRDDLLRRLES